MRLFLYYASHSLLNTIKKMMKTWVIFMVICMAFGLMIGFGTTLFIPDDDAEDTKIELAEDGTVEEVPADEPGRLESFMTEHNITKEMIVDLAISAVFLLTFATNIINAKNSNKIFLPADVSMLFSSPMKPQSVLMFRLLCTLGSSVLLSVFVLFQIPNLTQNAGFSLWGAFSIVIVYMFTLILSTLVQVVFYTLTSRMKNGAGNMNRVLAGVYGLIGLGFVLYITGNKMDIISGVFAYFASPSTHWVPFWGWLRGIAYYAVTGDTKLSIFYMLCFLAACALIVLVIWRVKADFYEDAMFAAEFKAEQLENARRSTNGATVIRDKERKGELNREGFRFGNGANVFFYKAVFNRFRFAKLKILSTTMVVYTVTAILVAHLAKSAPFEDVFFIPAAALGVMAFYRTLGDPIREDTSKAFFLLIPESGYSKLFYSLLGSLAVTAIDLFVPMVVAAIYVGANPIGVVLWFLFILSISFFATTVGTFISLSLPADVAKLVGTIVQMVFLYFGLVPSAVAVIVGVLTGHLFLALAIGSVMNLVIGFLVTLILPNFLGRH
ncbi:MAG: putative ABC exporter domain-containing protein [Saccharofermentans sp.]|nr:putative ABC exporter domain-containing protein [Saccharofermentans sp.]